MVFEVRAEMGNPRGSIACVAEQLGINKETPCNWVNQAGVDDGQPLARPTSMVTASRLVIAPARN
jgi:transposase-like protein